MGAVFLSEVSWDILNHPQAAGSWGMDGDGKDTQAETFAGLQLRAWAALPLLLSLWGSPDSTLALARGNTPT